jgi:hypothetical protein
VGNTSFFSLANPQYSPLLRLLLAPSALLAAVSSSLAAIMAFKHSIEQMRYCLK